MLDKEKIGKTIAFYRKERGMTQKELAELLHISYQAVSKWEAGVSMPTVEMLYELSELLNITVDSILNDEKWENRSINFMDVGLNTRKLQALKKDIMNLATEDERLISAQYADAALFQIDTSKLKNPVYSMITCVPGSKEKLANMYGYDQEICNDVAVSGINHLLQHGMKPVILKGMLLCNGNKHELFYHMAQGLKKVCEENDILFAGMEIAAQPVNFKQDEYHISVTMVGVADKENLIDGSRIQEGDILIGIRTEGIDGTNYPVVKVMIDRKPDLLYEEMDNGQLFLNELMKGNTAFTKEVYLLQEEGILHGVYRIRNQLLNQNTYLSIPEGLGICIDLTAIPVTPLYHFLYNQNMIGENMFPYCFHFGIGMVVVVPKEKKEQAMEIIKRHHDCCCIGEIKKCEDRDTTKKVWAEGKVQW